MSDIRYCSSCNIYTKRHGKDRGYRCKKCGKIDVVSFVPMFSKGDIEAIASRMGIEVKRKRPKKKNRKKEGKR